MRTLTDAECREWCAANGVALSADICPSWPPEGMALLAFRIPGSHARLYWFSRYLESVLPSSQQRLMWVVEVGVWPDSENWALFNRFRQSYGESRTLEQAPGQLFEPDESGDFATFIELCILNGWGAYLATSPASRLAFISHDEYVELVASDAGALAKVQGELAAADVTLLK